MIRGIYTAVSGMIAQENKQNVITNNLANANTTGFKSDSLVFKSFKEAMIHNYDKNINGRNEKQELGGLSHGVSLDASYTEFTQGNLESTGKDHDFGIEGRGFFLVERNDGVSSKQIATRDGHFHTNQQGYLVNDNGDYLLDSNRNRINAGNNKVTVDPTGKLNISDKNGVLSSTSLAVVDFNDYNNLKKMGNNEYDAANSVDVAGNIKQGSLEKSNVNVINEMIEMMTVMRGFETDQKVVQTLDETLGKAVNNLGSVRG